MRARHIVFCFTGMMIVGLNAMLAGAGTLTVAPSDAWGSEVEFPADPLFSRGIPGVSDSGRWVKFSILLDPYDANIVHFQNSWKYVFHYEFAVEHLDPFMGMAFAQFNAVTLFEQDQQAIMGAVILPPLVRFRPPETEFQEYGIQFVRQDVFTREEIADLFNRVKASVQADSNVQAFYFPTYEQRAVALANEDWFAAQGIPLGSTAQWAQGNTMYAPGWALGMLKFVTASDITRAYQAGELTASDILLTDGIPAELPYVAGIVSLVPSTPNSHVAILANTYAVPFVYLALAQDAQLAQDLAGRRIILSVHHKALGGIDTRLMDTEDLLNDAIVSEILDLKRPPSLSISPIKTYGDVTLSTETVHPDDVCYVGGKASNFGILRAAVPDHSPRSLALTFDVWDAFMDQPVNATEPRVVAPGDFVLIYADGDVDQGLLHADFRLSRDGESLMLVASDGISILDQLTFEAQREDVSYGRAVDGADHWQFLSRATPGLANADQSTIAGTGLVINEFMASNTATLEDPDDAGQWPDWIELYNASDQPVTLNGLYLSDDVNKPTKWRVSEVVTGETLREEITHRLAQYPTYPPQDMQSLAADLEAIRHLCQDPAVTAFDAPLRSTILERLSSADSGFDPNAMLRFRSSTNVEDSVDFTGAGLYDSYSGCLRDDLDEDTVCSCDPNRTTERSVLEAIRKTFSSFYNDNAFLERLRRQVNESDVGMAVLVHHASPDTLELANGVATIEIDEQYGGHVIDLVTQAGAVSVTNPVDASTPEEVEVQVLSSGAVLPRLIQSSSLVPLGGTVMAWRDEYIALGELLMRVYEQFGLVTGKHAYALDLEYKLMAPGGAVLPEGGLLIKQVRQMPEPNQIQTPFLINTAQVLEVYSGEYYDFESTDVFSDHHLKCRMTLETRNTALDVNALVHGLYTSMTLEYLSEDHVETVSLNLGEEHTAGPSSMQDTWRVSTQSNRREYLLLTPDIVTSVSPGENPILTLGDLGSYTDDGGYRCLALTVRFDRPVTSWFQHNVDGDAESGLATTQKNRVSLWRPPEATENDVYRSNEYADQGITVHTAFYFPASKTGWSDRTAPLLRWEQTTIEGLTSEPIVLTDMFSQTYRPEHHNLIENFLFEPRLEPGISPTILAELVEADIRWIHVTIDNRIGTPGGSQSAVRTYGYDSSLTE
ncbi:MAG: hypothetical protein GY809_32455 [Planctomycetes bacterium]|nr:hypothetical protein [Planctomycetota bacterium]